MNELCNFHFLINIYQSKHMTDIKTSVLYVAGQPNMVTLDYLIRTDSNENKWVFAAKLC